MKNWLWIVFFLSPVIVYSQISSNPELLMDEKKKLILNIVDYHKMQDSIFNYQFNDVDRLNAYLLPTINVESRSDYSFNSVIEYLDFSKMDTFSEILLYKKDTPEVVAILSSPINGEYVLTPPLLNENNKFREITKRYELERIFVFKLPLFSEWWILDGNKLMIMNPKNGRVTKSEKYLRRKYDQQDFSNLMKGVLLIDNSDKTIKTLQMINGNN